MAFKKHWEKVAANPEAYAPPPPPAPPAMTSGLLGAPRPVYIPPPPVAPAPVMSDLLGKPKMLTPSPANAYQPLEQLYTDYTIPENPWDIVRNETDAYMPRWLKNLGPVDLAPQGITGTDGYLQRGQDRGDPLYWYSANPATVGGGDDYREADYSDPNSFTRMQWSPELQQIMDTGMFSYLNGRPVDVLDMNGNVTGQRILEGMKDHQDDGVDSIIQAALGIALGGIGAAATNAGIGAAGMSSAGGNLGAGAMGAGAEAAAGGGALGSAGSAGLGGMNITGAATEPVSSLGQVSGGSGFGFNGPSSVLDNANLFDPTGWSNPIQSTTGQMAGNIANSAGSSTIPGFGLSPSILPPVTPPGGIDFSQVPTPPASQSAAPPAQAPAAPPAAPDGVPPPANPNVSPTSLIPGVTNGQLLGAASTLAGALSGGQGQQSSTSQSRELPGFLQSPVANDLVPRTQGLLNTQMPQAQQAGQSMMTAGQGLLGRPVAGNGVGQITLQNPTTAQNPYLSSLADDMQRRTKELLDQNNLSIQGQFAGGPGLGGSRQGVAQGVAAGKAADYLSGNLAGLYGNAWNSDANRAMQKYTADQGFFTSQRGQDLTQSGIGAGLLSDGLNTQWGSLLNASRTYAPFTGFGNTTQSQESGGGWQGALGGALTGASLGRQMGWW